MWLIARLECYRLFMSPLAWVLMALVQLLLAYLFLTHIDYFSQVQGQIAAIPGAPGVTEMVVAPLLSNMAIVLLLVTPFITMRSFAEERRNDSLPLLMTAPLSVSQIVIGKYLGLLGFFGLLLLMLMLMPLSMRLGSPIDLFQLTAGFLGLLLLLSSMVAIGIFMSSLTAQPVIAAVSSFCLLFLLWIIDWVGQSDGVGSNVFSWLSLISHFEPLLRGEIFSADIIYYLLVTAAFLLMTIRRLDSLRVAS